MIVSPAHLVVGQQILSMVKKFARGIDVSTDTLALDLIDKIGPGGTFLMDPHTMQNFKSVIYPELFQRTMSQAPGVVLEDTLDDRLRKQTLELMKAPALNSLPKDIVAEFNRRQESWMAD